jgi:membrane protease YdiL (CAAX protease family)
MELLLRRSAQFLRSYLPAKMDYLLFVCGSFCLMIAPSLRWAPLDESSLHAEAGYSRMFPGYAYLLTLPVRLAGIAGLFVCFWPGQHPLRRLSRWVLLPALVGSALAWGAVVMNAPRVASVLEPRASRTWRAASQIPQLFWESGPGLHFALAGIALMGLGAWRLRRGLTDLPVRYALAEASRGPESEGQDEIKRELGYCWIVMGLPLAYGLLAGLLMLGVYFALRSAPVLVLNAIGPMQRALGSGLPTIAAVWALGREQRPVLLRMLRLPPVRDLALAVILPLLTAFLPLLLLFAEARIVWATISGNPESAPVLFQFFEFQRLDPWLLAGLLLAAPLEEIGWRGYLQPRFVQRFGLARGVFLVGLVWGAFHFGSDLRFGMDNVGVIVRVSERLLAMVLLSFPLAWLTLRSRSILPAALAHATSNVAAYGLLVAGLVRPEEVFFYWAKLAFWALLGYLLFRFWPPQMALASDLTIAPSEPQGSP